MPWALNVKGKGMLKSPFLNFFIIIVVILLEGTLFAKAPSAREKQHAKLPPRTQMQPKPPFQPEQQSQTTPSQHNNPILESKTSTPEPELPWRIGGKFGIINGFLRPEYKDWKVNSSYAFSVAGDRLIQLESLGNLKLYLGVELSTFYQEAALKNSKIKTTILRFSAPITVGYQLPQTNWSIGAKASLPLTQNQQSIFSTPQYNKQMSTVIPKVTTYSTLSLEILTEYQMTPTLSYSLSYNLGFSTLFLGGLSYAF